MKGLQPALAPSVSPTVRFVFEYCMSVDVCTVLNSVLVECVCVFLFLFYVNKNLFPALAKHA